MIGNQRQHSGDAAEPISQQQLHIRGWELAVQLRSLLHRQSGALRDCQWLLGLTMLYVHAGLSGFA